MKKQVYRVALGTGISIFVVSMLLIIFVSLVQYKSTWPFSYFESEKNSFVLGEYYFNQDEDPSGPYDLQKARYYYEQAILEDAFGQSRAWYQLGRIDFLEGDFDVALDKFDRYIEYSDSRIPNVYYLIGLTYGYKARQTNNLDHWKHSEEAFLTYLEFDAWSPWARTDLAWVYFSQGKYEEMIPVLELGLSKEPSNAWLLNMYGLGLRNTGQEDAAKEYFTRALGEAEKLTKEDWGRSYPGNNPKFWDDGLEEFRQILSYNASL